MSKIDDITIMNAWMFPTVFADERNLKLTKQLIEICMNRKIESIQQASVEHHVKPRLNSHGTRFDVKFVGDKEIYISWNCNCIENIYWKEQSTTMH